MSSFKRSLLGAAVAMAVVSLCAHAAESESMFKHAPSISDSETPSIAKRQGNSITKRTSPSLGEGQAMKTRRLPDGRVVVSGKMHGGRGIDMEVTIPKITPEVRMTGPAGVDENGNPMTWRQRKDREMAYRMVYEGLKAQGYDYETYKKSKEGVKTQLDMWNELTEETRRQIKEHGPINSKDFILPGSTPELSAQLSDPEVGVRKENGKLVYYLNGQRLNIYPEATPKKRIEPTPVTKTTTKVSKSQRKLTKEEEAQKKRELEARKGSPLDAMDKPAVDALPKAPPSTAYEPEPDEDLRRRPTDIILAPEDLPDAEEVRDRVEDMFPDMGKFDSLSMNEYGAKWPDEGVARLHSGGPGSMPAVGSLSERILCTLLGISEAVASESEDDINAAKAIRVGEKFQDLVDEIGVGSNNSLNSREYADILKEIRAHHDKVTKSVTQPSETPEGEEDGEPTYLGTVEVEGEHYDPAAFAADVVNRTTKSLTPEQFEEDVAAVVGSLSETKVNGGVDVLSVLEDILKANPEIFEAIPDADKQLQRLRGDVYDITPPNPNGEQTFIFVSYSLSEDVLKDIIERNAHRSDVTLVMRGVPEGMRIDNGMLKLQTLINEAKSSVALVLDPPLFDVYGITQVPAVVRAGRTPSKSLMNPNDPKGRRYATMVAKVEGLHNDRWLLEQIEAGERGDLGLQGNVKEIAEPNLIDEMKKRVAAIDWDKKKKEAIKRFWKKQTFKVFPTAEKGRVREIDPSILVERDLKDLAGRPIRRAGDIVNPLQIRPFTQTVLIFNPLSEDEMARVAAFRKAYEEAGKLNLVLIATQMDKEKSWEGYKSLTDKLDAHVFMMTPEIEYQWHIEKTPAVITADNNRHLFLVEELGPVKEEEVK